MSGLYWANRTRKVCMGVESLLLYNVYVVSVVLNVVDSAVYKFLATPHLEDQNYLGADRRWSWKRSKMWTHRLQRLDDRCPSLFSPWLTESMSMWPQSADNSRSWFVARGLGCCCMIWSAATKKNAAALWCKCLLRRRWRSILAADLNGVCGG